MPTQVMNIGVPDYNYASVKVLEIDGNSDFAKLTGQPNMKPNHDLKSLTSTETFSDSDDDFFDHVFSARANAFVPKSIIDSGISVSLSDSIVSAKSSNAFEIPKTVCEEFDFDTLSVTNSIRPNEPISMVNASRSDTSEGFFSGVFPKLHVGEGFEQDHVKIDISMNYENEAQYPDYEEERTFSRSVNDGFEKEGFERVFLPRANKESKSARGFMKTCEYSSMKEEIDIFDHVFSARANKKDIKKPNRAMSSISKIHLSL
jgi:hypothetical protein